MRQVTYLNVPAPHKAGVGMVSSTDGLTARFTVFHNSKQGLSALADVTLLPNQQNWPAHIENGAYLDPERSVFHFNPYVSTWLEKQMQELPGFAKYSREEPPRLSLFCAFRRKDQEPCGALFIYNGSSCHVFTFYSQEQGYGILGRFHEATTNSIAAQPDIEAEIASIILVFPLISPTPVEELGGEGALELCAAIEMNRNAELLFADWG